MQTKPPITIQKWEMVILQTNMKQELGGHRNHLEAAQIQQMVMSLIKETRIRTWMFQ